MWDPMIEGKKKQKKEKASNRDTAQHRQVTPET